MKKWLIKLCDSGMLILQNIKDKLAHELLHNEYHVKSDVVKDIPTYYSLIEREWELYSKSVHSLLDLVEDWDEFTGAKNFQECWEILKVTILRDHYKAKEMNRFKGDKLIDSIERVKRGKQYENIDSEYFIVNWGYMHRLLDLTNTVDEQLIRIKTTDKLEWNKGESKDYAKYDSKDTEAEK